MDIRTEPRGLSGFGNLAFARMKDGYSIAAVDYDMDDVRQMRRNLWANHLATRRRRLVT